MMTPRVERLKRQQAAAKPTFSVERARLVTEAYEKYGAEPNILLKAKALEHILKNMTIFILDGELIVGNHTDKQRCAPVYPEFAAKWIIDQIEEFTTRNVDKMYITKEEQDELVAVLKKWEGKSFDQATAGVCPPETLAGEAAGAFTVGARDCCTGHILADYPRLFDGGLNRAIAECQENIRKTAITCREDQEKVDFWNACIIAAKAAIQFAGRYADLAEEKAKAEDDPRRKEELLEIAKNCRNIPANGPVTFFEAVQYCWFVQLIVSIEDNGHGNSFGPFDRYTNKYYVEDLKAGRITEERALEILECFFIKLTDIIKLRDAFYSEAFAGYPVWQNLVIGGMDSDGTDACNEVTRLVLKANADVQTSQPAVSLRYHDGMAQDVFDMGVSMIQKGLSTPAFFNDKLVVPIMLSKGASIPEARYWGIYGCVQPCVAGYSDGRPQVGYVNFLKCLELAMHDGVDPLTGRQIGPKTGKFTDFKTMEEFTEAVYDQLRYCYHLMLTGYTAVTSMHAVRQNMPFSSIMVSNCIEKGRSLQQGGAKYNESGCLGTGLGNTADAMAAIKKFVFDEKVISKQELLDVLTNNFEGSEPLRQLLLNKAPKYGNDIDSVDRMAADIVKCAREHLENYRDSRGGKYVLDIESQSLNIVQGKCIGATPDGRYAYTPLADNCSPVMGRDVNGPTATVLSVAKLDQINTNDGALFNLRFDPRTIAGAKGRQVIGSVIKTYFDHFGEHIQINVVSDETLKAAQKHPEDYRDLLVRVAGYLAYFTELDKEVQDNIIARTAHDC
ncbi:glycyl radical protein [Bacilliculturomica massiliensis]|uniref:glycyl radical protein n=1 Tax=Bacilliculturomica massiliensis TaxID=1917867 RepID=UPI0013EF54F7|nr:formate C-acetyltransferase/glycerol dehydratase family glycyl radical enzyme [Bacilliculturomica massiliensis]